jgi:hypothetical protein
MLARFCLAVGLLSSSVFADDTTRLIVNVRTLGDKPVDRASVIVDFVEGRSVVKLGKKMTKHWELRTNQEGVAKLPPVPEGKVRVQVIAKNYQTHGEIVELDGPERVLTVKLNPPQQPYSAHQ